MGHVFFDVQWAGLIAVDFDARAKAGAEVQAKNIVNGHFLDGLRWGWATANVVVDEWVESFA
jgi:hypothetical protein